MYYKKLSILLFETKQNDLMNLVFEQTSAVDLLTNLLSDLGDDEKKEIYNNVFGSMQDEMSPDKIIQNIEDNPEIADDLLSDPESSGEIFDAIKDSGQDSSSLLDKLGVDIPEISGDKDV